MYTLCLRFLCLGDYRRTWRYPQNRKHVTYRNAARGGRGNSHRQQSQKWWFGHPVFTARRYASAVFAVAVYLLVWPSVTSRYCIETTGRIELVFGIKASFHLSYTVLPGNSGISKNKGTSLWNFVSNSGLKKISPQQVDRVVNITRRRSSLRITLATVYASWLAAHSLLHALHFHYFDCGFVVQLVPTVVQQLLGFRLT